MEIDHRTGAPLDSRPSPSSPRACLPLLVLAGIWVTTEIGSDSEPPPTTTTPK